MTDQPIDTPDRHEDLPSGPRGEEEKPAVGNPPRDDGAPQIAADDAGASALTEEPQPDRNGDTDGEKAD